MFIIKILVSSFAVIISEYFLPGVSIDKFTTAIIVALVLSFLNAFLKPIIVFLTIPVTMLTFGLFLVVINAFMIQLTAYFVYGFKVDGFWWAFLFSIILSIVTSLFEKLNETSQKPHQ
ncbi:MAG: phage holin family protein [Bacteroidales bacterium]|nr:phage holin family protein [Bacteroidales bacterium]